MSSDIVYFLMIMKAYKSYLFDFDGTLVDTWTHIVGSYQYVFSYVSTKYNLTLNVIEDDLRRNMGIPLRQTMQMYFADNQAIVDEVVEIFMNYQAANWRKFVKVFDGALEILKELKLSERSIAVVTSRKLQSTKLYSDELGIGKWIDLYMTPELVTHPKPHPESAIKVSQILETSLSDCLFVGDSIFDIQCAQAAGMDSALVSWGATLESEFACINPTYVINSFSDLLSDSVLKLGNY